MNAQTGAQKPENLKQEDVGGMIRKDIPKEELEWGLCCCWIEGRLIDEMSFTSRKYRGSIHGERQTSIRKDRTVDSVAVLSLRRSVSTRCKRYIGDFVFWDDMLKDMVALYFGNHCEIDRAAGGKLCDKNADESWGIIEKLSTTMRAGMIQKTTSNRSRRTPGGINTINEAERKADDEPAKSARETVTKNEEDEPAGVSGSHAPLSIYNKLTDERPSETDIRHSLASHSYIYPLGIAKDVLVDVAGYLRIEKGIKNDIEPIAATRTVNRLVLEWEEKIRLHQEKQMKFDQWRSYIYEKKLGSS
ncbi:hypothetical protein Tco_1576644 [Tanacetum coccineum]